MFPNTSAGFLTGPVLGPLNGSQIEGKHSPIFFYEDVSVGVFL